MARPGISGLAIGAIVAGDVLFLSGLHGGTVADTLRALLKGDPLPPGKSFGRTAAAGVLEGLPPPAGSPLGAQVASMAQTYIGVPYVWAGEDPSGWDCSGFVTWVLVRNGIQLPSNHHTVAAQFYTWSGAYTIPRDQCSPGDLVCWPTHVGIAVSNVDMVHAPGLGQKTRQQRIWSTPAPSIRRPKAYR